MTKEIPIVRDALIEYVEPERPPEQNLYQKIQRTMFLTQIVTFNMPKLIYSILTNITAFKDILKKVFSKSIKYSSHYKCAETIKEVWNRCTGQLYLRALEYQKMEGFCAPATVRVVVKSIPGVAEQTRGPSIPSKIIQDIDSGTNGVTHSVAVYGSEGYEAFLNTIKLSNNKKYRFVKSVY